jgi:UDP-2,3-diacylglucosamine hydrolase
MPGAVYFFSDAHLGAGAPEEDAARERRLLDFLGTLEGRAAALYVVGDLFDFWFEYRTAIPRRHFRVLNALGRLRASGIPVTYLGGNHDFWIGDFLQKELGVEVRENPLELSLQGRRIWVHHGDALVGGDLGYRMLKQVLRNKTCIALYRLIHPDLGIPFAEWVSSWSRHSRAERPLDVAWLRREVAEPRFEQGFDTVMIGHFHHVVEDRAPGREFFVLGDWIEHFSYLVLENGAFRMERFRTAP